MIDGNYVRRKKYFLRLDYFDGKVINEELALICNKIIERFDVVLVRYSCDKKYYPEIVVDYSRISENKVDSFYSVVYEFLKNLGVLDGALQQGVSCESFPEKVC